ncbi:RUS family member 1 isoform X3 [Cotesia typhae]|uniref:RUS family member 1 isoform X3 n=1 Tax=Cotesia typhae TaxID=2053667 RepID=UPI003D69A45F
MARKILFYEIYGNDEKKNIFIKSVSPTICISEQQLALEKNNAIINNETRLFNLKSFLKKVFLPQGFPDSVHPDYIPYQIWDTIQAFASTVLGALTTHSVLQSVGVGESTATASAAAISWILKDGTGMIGRIIFTWWKSIELDAQCKKWRLTADILNDLAMGIELTLPSMHSSSVTMLLCLSTAMKSIVGVAGGATRAALTQHQALKVEMYLILVTIHIYANYSAVKVLTFNSLNEDRLILLFHNYINNGIIHDTKLINQQESLLPFHNSPKHYSGFSIKLGISLSDVIKNPRINNIEYLTKLMNHFRKKPFLIIPDIRKEIIYVVLRKNILSVNILEAYFNAYIYAKFINLQLNRKENVIDEIKSQGRSFLSKLYTLSKSNVFNVDRRQLTLEPSILLDSIIDEEFNHWNKLLQKSEWLDDSNLLPVNNWRGEWDT